MNKILINKETVELALEALGEIALAGMSGTGQESDEAMTEWHARQAWKFIGIAARQLDSLRQALKESSDSVLREQSTEQEPVGFMCQGCFYELDDVDEYCEMEHVYLYTQPQEAAPRKPLTDEQILDVNMSTVTKVIDEPIVCDTDHNIIQFARAIEAAHGITGEKEC